jgi:hypothetical protein
MLSTDSGRAILETTHKMMILLDEDFDEVVRADLKLIKKQACADMEKDEKSFTLVTSKVKGRRTSRRSL